MSNTKFISSTVRPVHSHLCWKLMEVFITGIINSIFTLLQFVFRNYLLIETSRTIVMTEFVSRMKPVTYLQNPRS